MNEKLKIKRLWHYLRIQDEVLAIHVHNPAKQVDEYLVAEMIDGELDVHVEDELQVNRMENLRIISQRNEDGKYEIPDVEQMIREKHMDY